MGQKCCGIVNSNAWARQERNVGLKKSARTSVMQCVQGCVKLVVLDEKPESAIKEILDFKRTIASKLLGSRTDLAATLPMLSWATPCGLSKNFQQLQTTVSGEGVTAPSARRWRRRS